MHYFTVQFHHAVESSAFARSHSVRMYAATKSFERFWQPINLEDETKSIDNAVPQLTAYKTQWSCTLFKEWKQN